METHKSKISTKYLGLFQEKGHRGVELKSIKIM